ncbi:ADP-ribose pyrophosphatase [Streptomyces sp. TLI_053]|uniref:NUDIX hydrolase n=1 Tax=Streptomyces sp. TLI_053 TaxID=1855352 RepID=UPI000879F661|nr:NUDIX hydrolase [Streptomyces sp. TLI_053]SDT83432.1 ADP-ribose pyrophosphatase [Streptomyces sp. TLI_053]
MTDRWTETGRSTVFQVMGRTLDKVTYRLPDGTSRDKLLRNEPSAAAVLALTPDNKVIIARQYRPGPDAVLPELPGGFIEPGEDPATAAGRELLEETGYKGDLELAGSCWDDAGSTAKRWAFVARNCVRVADQDLDEMEFVDVALLTLEEFRQVVRDGLMTDVELAYRGLDHLGLL